MLRLLSLAPRTSNVSSKSLAFLNIKRPNGDANIQDSLVKPSLLSKRQFGKRAPSPQSSPAQKPNKLDILKSLKPSHQIPLDQKFPGSTDYPLITKPLYAKDPPTFITTLPNGIRVATEEISSQTASISIIIDSGVKYENDRNHGASRFLERMAFKSTKNRTAREFVQEIEDMGVNMMSSSSRELMSYSADCLGEHLPNLMSILSDAIFNPAFLQEEVDEQKKVLARELEELDSNIESFIVEQFHEVAFQGQPLGRSMIVPWSALENITPEILREFHKAHYTPERIVISASGTKHALLVDLVQKYFNVPRSSDASPGLPNSIYTGGELRTPERPKTKPVSSIVPQDRPCSYLILGFPGVSVSSPEFFALSTLVSLLGGGEAFSSGGPGKGMHSRLYTNVLGGNDFVEACVANNFSYKETGLFLFYSKVTHGNFIPFLNTLLGDMIDLSENLSQTDLDRAKNQLKSNIFMALEQRTVKSNDIGSQIMFYGNRLPSEQIVSQIDKLTVADAKMIFKKTLSSKPTLVSYGKNLEEIPSADEIQRILKTHLV